MGLPAPFLHPDFVPEPYWWSFFRPASLRHEDFTSRSAVVVIGGGYAGLSAALELARRGIDCIVLDASDLGSGASTRNGGGFGANIAIGKSFTGQVALRDPQRIAALRQGAARAFDHTLGIIAREGIDCSLELNGRFMGCCTPAHFDAQMKDVAQRLARGDESCFVVARRDQHSEIASDYYHGGAVSTRGATINPALYFEGLVRACRSAGVRLAARTMAQRIDRAGSGWRVRTDRGDIVGDHVLIATNGYSGALQPFLQRRVIPIASHVVATEEMPAELAEGLIPNRRMITESKRVLCYYRLSPDRRRLIFGGRARFTAVQPQELAGLLHGMMVERFPQLSSLRITHAWSGNTAFTFDALPHTGRSRNIEYSLGCNGSGIAMMSYLGAAAASRIAGDRPEDCAFFDGGAFPGHPLYAGSTWFLPIVGGWFRLRDRLDRRWARLRESGKATA